MKPDPVDGWIGYPNVETPDEVKRLLIARFGDQWPCERARSEARLKMRRGYKPRQYFCDAEQTWLTKWEEKR